MDIEVYLYGYNMGDCMKYNYAEYVSLFKAIADQTRLNIVDLLSGGEMCACQLLDNFNITQPTLSYHMKILCDSGIVNGRREGSWMYYSINGAVIETISEFFVKIKAKTQKDDCIGKPSAPCNCK